MVYCAFPKCKSNRGDPKYDLLSFHKFPREPQRRRLWVDQVNRPNWKPSQHSLVCSCHFSPDDYKRKGELGRLRWLSKSAVPKACQLDDTKPLQLNVKKSKRLTNPLPKIHKVFTAADWNEEASAMPLPPPQSRIVFSHGDDTDQEWSEGTFSNKTESTDGSKIFSDSSIDKCEIGALKKTLFENQLTIHKLKYDVKQVSKERDEFEKLLTDSEAKNFEAAEIRTMIEDLLSEDFKSVETLKQSIRVVLDSSNSSNQAKPVHTMRHC